MDFSTYLTHQPTVEGFFDEQTHTISYVVADEVTKKCTIIDSVMDFDQSSGTLSHTSADKLISFVSRHDYTVEWILETHVHADHLSAAPYIQEKLGGKIAISEFVTGIQETFGAGFNEGDDFARDGSQFDHLWRDEETFTVGSLPAAALHVPGHTPADMVYIIGNAVFAGDTMFMPDYGTARCDFPGGSAEMLYTSAQKIFALPEEMRMFMCHDYLPEGRDTIEWETTIGTQKKTNIHLKTGSHPEEFIAMRSDRDATLGMPALIIPAIQVNIRAGNLPPEDTNGITYLKTPINGAFTKELS